MYTLNNAKESEETIFLQAIDQIYEINKNYLDSSEDEFNEDYENGEINLNFDFIDDLDEALFSNQKKEGKSSEKNLSNSSVTSESTEFESFCTGRSISEKFVTEARIVKIKDFLANKFESNGKLDQEICSIKDNILNNFEINDNQFKIKCVLPTNSYENIKFFNSNNSNNSIYGLNLNNYNCNFPNMQNFACNSYQFMEPQSRNTKFNSVHNNYQTGFFQQSNFKKNNKNVNIKIESSVFGSNLNRRKDSFPVENNH